MNTEKWQKLNELFAAALETETDRRPAFIAAVEDDEIRAELESLLKSHEVSDKFLNQNAVEISARTLIEDDAEKLIGQQIGQFKIVREIGRGGMGAVFLAERTGADFTQKAALKLIKRGMDTDFIINRFQTERRILSRLNHPFIAKLLDGGTTEDGLPYFVMEYVEGENLKDYSRNQRLSTDAKLRLFRQICEAVQYAHRNLVVHRDLKPSNIIITEDGTPKLLDFGIAKVLDHDAENTDRTTTEYRLLTPKYASPEQIRGELVGTQSDVYSLGVLLDEILSVLPTTADSQNQTAESRSKAYTTAAHDSELKTIISKALHEETTRRYASVEQFSEDIRRYENGLPILAQADSFGYRARKFMGRHRFGVLTGGLILLTLFGGIGATFWQFRRAQAEKNLAQTRFDDVRGLANSVIFDLHDEIQNLPGSTKARKLLIEKALEYLNKLERDAGGDAGLQHELAMAYMKIADVQGQIMEASLLETDKAVINYRKALELEERAVAADPKNFEFRRDLALICYRFAEALRGSNDLTETLALEKRAVEIYEPLTREHPEDMEIRRRWLIARSGYADVLRESGELQPSIPLYEQNLKDTQTALQAAPADVKLNRFLAIAYGGYSNALYENNEGEKALEYLLIAKQIAQKASDANPNDAALLRGVGVACEGVGRFASNVGKNELAEENARENVRIMEKIAKDDAENLEAKYDVGSSNNNYADFLEKNNRWPEAFERRQRTLGAIAALEKNENNPEIYAADFFEFYAKYARVAARLGKKDLAAEYCQKAENLNFQIEKTTGEIRNLYAGVFILLGEAYWDLGQKDKARSYYSKAVEAWKALQAEGKFYPLNAKNLSEAEQKLNQ